MDGRGQYGSLAGSPLSEPLEPTAPPTQFADQHDTHLLTWLNDAARRAYAKLPTPPSLVRTIWNTAVQLWDGLISAPFQAGVQAFFVDEHDQYCWNMPLINLAMIPGNAAMVLGNLLLPIAPDGQLGVPIVAGLFPLTNTIQLFNDARNQSLSLIHRIKNPAAAIMGLSACYYSALFTYILAYNLFFNLEDEQLPYRFTPHDLFNTAATIPSQGAELFYLLTLSYIAAINGYLSGRNSVLHGAQNSLALLRFQIENDYLELNLRRIDALKDPKEKTTYRIAQGMDEAYQTAVRDGKNRYLIDYVFVVWKSIWLLPASTLSLPRRIAKEIPLIKAQLESSGLITPDRNKYYLKPLPELKERQPRQYPQGITTLAIKVSWISPPPLNTAFKERQNLLPPPYYNEMLHLIMVHDYRDMWGRFLVRAFLNYLNCATKRTEDCMLGEDLLRRYLRSVLNHKLGLPLPLPLMPHRPEDRPEAFYNLAKLYTAHNDPAIAKMLRGDFSRPHQPPILSLMERAHMFNEKLYDFICEVTPSSEIPTPVPQGEHKKFPFPPLYRRGSASMFSPALTRRSSAPPMQLPPHVAIESPRTEHVIEIKPSQSPTTPPQQPEGLSSVPITPPGPDGSVFRTGSDIMSLFTPHQLARQLALSHPATGQRLTRSQSH